MLCSALFAMIEAFLELLFFFSFFFELVSSYSLWFPSHLKILFFSSGILFLESEKCHKGQDLGNMVIVELGVCCQKTAAQVIVTDGTSVV